MPDLTIKHATVITKDAARRVLDDISISIRDGRITAIGGPADESGGEVIDGRDMVALPGLIDCHGHAGHTLLKSIGAGRPGQWQEAVHKIFRAGNSADFWYANAELLALERLKAGVTTGVSLLGGPVDYVRWLDDGPATQTVGFDEQMAVSEALIRECDGSADGRFRIATTMPVYKPWEIGTLLSMAEAAAMSARVRDLGERYGLRFTQDGHREGSLALAGELGLLGSASLMSHSVDLSEADFTAVVESDTRIVHNPYAVRSILGRCPVLDAGVTVVLGSDAAAPDRGYDMFRHIAQCMHYHRRHFRDPDLLPPGKMLEMVTMKHFGVRHETFRA